MFKKGLILISLLGSLLFTLDTVNAASSCSTESQCNSYISTAESKLSQIDTKLKALSRENNSL